MSHGFAWAYAAAVVEADVVETFDDQNFGPIKSVVGDFFNYEEFFNQYVNEIRIRQTINII